jgi:DNA repair exonuclease SbcCD ATPase subunit
MTKSKGTAVVVPAAETTVVIRTPEAIAAEIRFIDAQARQHVAHSALEIGKRLTEVKEQIPHGEWGVWLQTNVNYSQSTANNFMRLAEKYAGSPELTNLLSYSQAVALLAVSDDEREQFVADNNVAEMSSRELAAAIKEKKELEKRLEEEQKHQEEQKKQYDEWAAKKGEELKRLKEQQETEAAKRQEQEQELAALQLELDKAKATDDDKAVAKMKSELRKAEKAKSEQEQKVAALQKMVNDHREASEKELAERIKQREKELSEQAENDKKAALEQADKEKQTMKAEMDKLNQQLARSNNESFLRAKLAIDQIVKDGDALVKAIAAVPEADEQAKLKAAAAKIMEQLRSAL